MFAHPLASKLGLSLPLMLCVGCADAEPRACVLEGQPSGMATFDGVPTSYELGRVRVYVDGPDDARCIEYVEVSLEADGVDLDVYLSPIEGSGAFEVSNVAVTTDEPFIAHGEDLINFDVDAMLGEIDSECTEASISIAAEHVGMALEASEDWGHALDDVALSFVGVVEVIRREDEGCT